MSALNILLAEDSEDDAYLMSQYLRRLGVEFTLERVETAAELSAAFSRQSWDLVISDYRMPKFSGLAALKLVREHDKELPFIIVSATIGEEIAVETMRAGANDYVMKNNLARLLPAIQRELHDASKRADSRAANKAQQQKLDYLAYYDTVTGLANRSLFLERATHYLNHASAAGRKLAVVMIDLERFKSINDELGRPAGDALLRQVTEWLTLQAGDAKLLARVGPDHFAMVLPQWSQNQDVPLLLDAMRQAFMNHAFRLNNAEFRVAFKSGIAIFPDDGADADALLKHAEAALKKAKADGEPYLFYVKAMTAAISETLTLENQLRQALEREEFVLYYQPKVDLVTGRITGAEALIRWNDPRTGLVPPGRFIPILEETGLIHDVGRWALQQAVNQYLRWDRAGLAVGRIAVNVSPIQLRHRHFVSEIKQVTGIDVRAPGGLELEITESVIMEDVSHSISTLKAIRGMGVSIAIDDFGTGYSSLSYLAKLPVDSLKIDRSFVIDIDSGAAGLALVSTIITLAHSLKLRVVAEGVETDEQLRLLKSLCCNEMQGYLFSKPVPSDVFEKQFLRAPQAATAAGKNQ